MFFEVIDVELFVILFVLEFLICDDLNIECVDFIVVNFFEKKIVFIYVKVGFG